jgi:hypothetical protein
MLVEYEKESPLSQQKGCRVKEKNPGGKTLA